MGHLRLLLHIRCRVVHDYCVSGGPPLGLYYQLFSAVFSASLPTENALLNRVRFLAAEDHARAVEIHVLLRPLFESSLAYAKHFFLDSLKLLFFLFLFQVLW